MDLNKVKQRLEQTRGGFFKPKRESTYQHYEAEGVLPKIEQTSESKDYLSSDTLMKMCDDARKDFSSVLWRRYGAGGDPFAPTIDHIFFGITSREDVIKERKLVIIDRIEKMREGYPNSPVKIRKKNYETDAKIKAAISIVGKDLLKEYLCDDCNNCW